MFPCSVLLLYVLFFVSWNGIGLSIPLPSSCLFVDGGQSIVLMLFSIHRRDDEVVLQFFLQNISYSIRAAMHRRGN